MEIYPDAPQLKPIKVTRLQSIVGNAVSVFVAVLPPPPTFWLFFASDHNNSYLYWNKTAMPVKLSGVQGQFQRTTQSCYILK